MRFPFALALAIPALTRSEIAEHSGTGCIASPIFEDGSMLSLPIPDQAGTICYDDLHFGGHSVGKLIADLKGKRISKGKTWSLAGSDRAHLDPDLIPALRDRKLGWRPAFGQCGKDATILRQHEVGIGDLFLYFGWFRRCEMVKGAYRYVAGAPNLHVVFGYLRVGQVIRISSDPVPEWAFDHPHLHGTARKKDTGNTLFVAETSLGLPSLENQPGAGAFSRFEPQFQLTAPGKSRSQWRLPLWFFPTDGAPSLSSHHHNSNDRWQKEENSCLLRSVARGQEFVVDAVALPNVINWATDLLTPQRPWQLRRHRTSLGSE